MGKNIFYNKFTFLSVPSVVGLGMIVSAAPVFGATLEIPLPQSASNVTTDPAAYIQYFFTFGLGLVGFLAVAAVVVGGIMYMTGSTVGSVDKAKTIITGAITGIVLLLCSYLLLAIIDPTLTNLSPLGLQPAPAVDPIQAARPCADPTLVVDPASGLCVSPFASSCSPPCSQTQDCMPPRGCVDRPTGTAQECSNLTTPRQCTAARCVSGGSCYMGTYDTNSCECIY